MISEINKNGFLFKKIDISNKIIKDVLSSKEPTKEIKKYFIKTLKDFDPDIKKIHCVYEDIKYGMHHEMHTHLTPSRYQAILWFPLEDFEGRDFIYGTKDFVKTFKPNIGDICFMKTNDLKFIHGVSPLKTDTLVRTLIISIDHVTCKGEHLTVSADKLKNI